MDERPTPTVFGAIWTYRWMVVIIVAVFAVLSAGFGFLTLGQTTTTAKVVLATPTSDDQPLVGVVASTEPTFVRYVAQRAIFATSNAVLADASKVLGNESVQALRDHISATSGSSGGTILITASAKSAQRAATLANAVSAAYSRQSLAQISAKATQITAAIYKAEALIKAQVGPTHTAANTTYAALQAEASSTGVEAKHFGSGVTFTDPATEAGALKPKLPYIDTAVGVALGLLVAATIAWIRADRRNRPAFTDQQIQLLIGAPSFAEVPNVKALNNTSGIDRTTLPAKPFQLAWIAAHSRVGTGVYLVGGPESGDGRTTAALHLAASAARDGYRVLLVDGVQRKRGHGLTTVLDLNDADAGYEVLVAQQVKLNEVVYEVDLGEGTMLGVLPAGEPRPLPVGAHRMDAVAAAIAAMRESFDVVFIDSAPAVDLAENAALAKHVDHIIVVVREDGDRIELQRYAQRLSLFEAKPDGYVVNFAKSARLTTV